MNEEPTKRFPDRRSFEDRIFERFDTIDKRFERVYARFDVLEVHLEKLESRSYDTKPIWERALAAISQTNQEVGEIKNKVVVIETKVQNIESEIGIIKTDQQSIRNELVDVRRRLKHNVGAKLDMIQTLLIENRDDIRDAEERIRDLESKLA